MSEKKTVLLFSTLNPFPFWAGSENFWFDFTRDPRVSASVKFTCALAKSPVTMKKAEELNKAGASVEYYDHFNVHFTKRNYYKLLSRLLNKEHNILPWFDKIKSNRPDLVWFNVAGLEDLLNLEYPVSICQKLGIPYWMILQHGSEDYFLSNGQQVELVRRICTGAKRFIFISDRNRESLERAITLRLNNATRSVNAISHEKIIEAGRAGDMHPPSKNGKARFFNLGRYSPRDKAQHLLIMALARQQWKDRDWQLSFIGVDEFGQRSLQEMADMYGLSKDRLNFISFTNKVFEAISSQDVLLMPSFAEGTPYAMVESMAAGRPALGTPIGGIPELIENGKTGWLMNGTQLDDLSGKLEEMWASREQWAECGRKARELVLQQYDQERSHPVLLDQLLADLRK